MELEGETVVLTRGDFRSVTHTVDPEEMRPLLEAAPRVYIAFVANGSPEIVPARLEVEDGRYWIGVPEGQSAPGPEQALKLLVDEGMHYYEMRGIWIHGLASYAEAPPGGGEGRLQWFELVPERRLAWDFGAMRKARQR